MAITCTAGDAEGCRVPWLEEVLGLGLGIGGRPRRWRVWGGSPQRRESVRQGPGTRSDERPTGRKARGRPSHRVRSSAAAEGQVRTCGQHQALTALLMLKREPLERDLDREGVISASERWWSPVALPVP